MLFQPTELSYLSEVTGTNSLKSSYSIFSNNSHLSSSTKIDDDFYNKKIKGNMHNNIFKEIDSLKKKDKEEKINYINLLEISEQDYHQAEMEVNNLIDSLNEDHLIEIQSIKKPTNIEKRVFEFFSYLLGEPYFEFKNFKEKLNLYELKYKLVNMEYEKIDSKKVNYILNLIANNNKMTLENLVNEISVLEVLFRWVQNILKIYLYKVQNKLLKSSNQTSKTQKNANYNNRNRSMANLKNSNSINSNNMNINTGNSKNKIGIGEDYNIKSTKDIKELKDIKDVSKPNKLEPIQINQPISIRTKNLGSNTELENIKELNTNSMNQTKTKLTSVYNENKNSNVYLTDLKPSQKNLQHINGHRPSKSISNTQTQYLKKTNTNQVTSPPVKAASNYNIELEGYDIAIDQRKSLIKTLESVTFIKHKTFHQLRKHFGMEIQSNQKISGQHVDDIWGSSLQNPKNIPKILARFSNGQIKGLDYATLGKFSQNLHNEEYFNGPNWYKK